MVILKFIERKNMAEKIYHYTKGVHLLKIIADGMIQLSGTFIEYGELPCVALTTNNIFEKSILPFKPIDNIEEFPKNKINSQNLPEMVRVDNLYEAAAIVQGFYRFEISNKIELYTWHEYERLCKDFGRINS